MTAAIDYDVTSSDEYLQATDVVASHEPWVRNGEKEVADLLRRRNLRFEYERRFYPLIYTPPGQSFVRWGGFCPDFYLPATYARPALNVEVTFADRGLPTMSREQRTANLRRIELKRLKIALTRSEHGIETILITRAVFAELRRDERYLDRLMRNAIARHYRQQRQRHLATLWQPLAA